ncbi:MAG: hypothetical protein IT441_04660 [Phycisphaeraceae bacterium]|nr:hypothetical protein [Phycisphaeraceae bacterium]
MMRRRDMLLAVIAVLACLSAAGESMTAGEKAFLGDIEALTAGPHRLAGTAEGEAAVNYVEGRLRAMGIEQVLRMEMPAWQTKVVRCEIRIGDKSYALLPMRPNLVVPPSTGPEGVSGPVIYVGGGTLAEYGGRSPEGAIVVLNYDCQQNWVDAMAMGARAVIFLGDGPQVQNAKHQVMPANLLRFYAPPGTLKEVDLRRDAGEATIFSEVRWELGTATNLAALIPGSDPGFVEARVEPELVVLASDLDSFGDVPEDSPNATGAANVAALLHTLEGMVKERPKRDVLALFLNNRARSDQGARLIYDALCMEEDESELLTQDHRDEQAMLTQMRQLLISAPGTTPTRQQVSNLIQMLDREAQRRRTAVNDELARMRLAESMASASDEHKAQMTALQEGRNRWDEFRRVLNNASRSPSSFDPAELEQAVARSLAHSNPTWPGERVEGQRPMIRENTAELREAVGRRISTRLDELHRLLEMDQQRQALRRLVSGRWIILHANFDLSDQGPTWSTVAGHSAKRLFFWTRQAANVDTPGLHKRLLSVIGRLAAPAPGSQSGDSGEGQSAIAGFDLRPVDDPDYGAVFAARLFMPSGAVASSFGFYGLSMMTGYDERPRQGLPNDDLEHLDWRRIYAQAVPAGSLLARVADSADVSLPRLFQDVTKTYRPDWSPNQIKGDMAILRSTGSLTEDWPAAGAVTATWPSETWFETDPWAPLAGYLLIPDYDPVVIEPTDANGRVSLIGVHGGDYIHYHRVAAMFDEGGQVAAINSRASSYVADPGTGRSELFPGEGFVIVQTQRGGTYQANGLRILRAVSNADLRTNRSLMGQANDVAFFYAHRFDLQAESTHGEARFKVVQPDGAIVLNVTPEAPEGLGMPASKMILPWPADAATAADLWALNEGRLATLRRGGVILPDLERLHSRAGRLLNESPAAPPTSAAAPREDGVAGQTAADEGPGRVGSSIVSEQSAVAQALALSRQVYTPLRAAMNDLINGIVALLLLAIPFAFSLERLLFCRSTVYGRLAGFAGCFLVTFGLLYLMHPGFAIAQAPVMILLAFAIILLSSLVSFIIMRKFRDQLMESQGQGGARHRVEISAMGTLLAAVGMGMSTMRRRPLRTTLTAVTVVMLTFTILCFASLSSQMGVRRVYEGPTGQGQRAAIFLRKLDYSSLSDRQIERLLGDPAQTHSLPMGHWWKVRLQRTDAQTSIARADNGRALSVDAVMGFDPSEMDHWPDLAQALEGRDVEAKKKALAEGGVYLPRLLQEQLGLRPGDPVMVDGKRLSFAGAIDIAAMQRLRHLDGRSILPVDFVAFEAERASGAQQAAQTDDRIQRDFQRLSPNQVAITSARQVRLLGGNLHVVPLYPRGPLDAAERGNALAQLTSVPVWTRTEQGVYRLFFTTLTEVSGGMALVVPILLGGLIIFGTMLGSITDREKEIYTFSALGLGPAHVGFLFFAEAAVYAVIGGMGGQLLAQAVAQAAAGLAKLGWIQTPSINFSSTNSMFAIGVVMATVMVSAIYPAVRASRSANPGLARAWKMPPPRDDLIRMKFPFTVSSYDITGVVSFLAEHFRQHDDAGLGIFATTATRILQVGDEKHLTLEAELALAPFDLGVTEVFRLTATPSEIPGVDEVTIAAERRSGARPDWYRANRVFVQDLRRQFLLWRTLSNEAIEGYRRQTLEELGRQSEPAASV